MIGCSGVASNAPGEVHAPRCTHRVLLETDRFLTGAGLCEAQPHVVLRTTTPLDATLTFQVVASAASFDPRLLPGDDAVLSVSDAHGRQP